MFDAHQPGWISTIRRDNPTARKVLSLHQDDLLAIEQDGQDRKLMRVVLSTQYVTASCTPTCRESPTPPVLTLPLGFEM